MTFGDIDAMNERALESLDRLAEIGTYDHTERLRMNEPLDEDEALTPSEAFALAQVSVHDPGLHSYRVDK
jgi:hypothetical protein